MATRTMVKVGLVVASVTAYGAAMCERRSKDTALGMV
jgi:hypothetical protein